MIISHRKRFVALLPWKTASSTFSLRLNRYNESPYSKFYDYNIHLNRVVHQHLTYSDFCLLPESSLSYYSASFIRNPYDRVYSGFQQLQRDIHEQPRAVYPQEWVRDLVMKQLAENFSQLCRAQFEFDRWLALVEERQVFEAGHNTSFPLHPAHYWTHAAGGQAVNFIGRVETFEADFAMLCMRLGIDTFDQVNANVSEPLEASHADPRHYRHIGKMSRQSIDKINSLFAADFDLFGYDRL